MAYVNALHVSMVLLVVVMFSVSLAALVDSLARPGEDWIQAQLSKWRWCAVIAASFVPLLGWPAALVYLRRIRPLLQEVEA